MARCQITPSCLLLPRCCCNRMECSKRIKQGGKVVVKCIALLFPCLGPGRLWVERTQGGDCRLSAFTHVYCFPASWWGAGTCPHVNPACDLTWRVNFKGRWMGISAAAISVSIRSFNPFGTSVPKLVPGDPKPPLSPGMLREMAAASCLWAGLECSDI